MQMTDFLQATRDLEGSRDVGAQLFCAMLRGAGVDARLVCSLQPLQFRATEGMPTPQRKYASIVPNGGYDGEESGGGDTSRLPSRSKSEPDLSMQ